MEAIKRRTFLGAAIGACTTFLPAIAPVSVRAAPYRTIPQRPSARVIVDNDFAGDPDGLVALAHQLLTPKTKTVLVTSSALDTKLTGKVAAAQTAAAGRDVALDLLRRAALRSAPPVVAGAETFGAGAGQLSPAARAIVAEAMRDDPLPLFITCGGPLTNIAAALRLQPAIARRATLVWIGGGAYPDGGWEYNLATDVEAARQVIERSAMPLWQVPQDAYRQMQSSVAELRVRMRPISSLGAWLYERFTDPPDFVDLGGSWPLGDSPTVLLTAISQESSRYTERNARAIAPDLAYGPEISGRLIRAYHALDARVTFEDFVALLALHAECET